MDDPTIAGYSLIILGLIVILGASSRVQIESSKQNKGAMGCILVTLFCEGLLLFIVLTLGLYRADNETLSVSASFQRMSYWGYVAFFVETFAVTIVWLLVMHLRSSSSDNAKPSNPPEATTSRQS